MRLLSTLILTHCFGYVFPEDADDVIKLEKFHITESTDNALKLTSNIVTIILIHKCVRDKQDESFISARLNSMYKCPASSKILKYHRRKLLDYSDNMIHESPAKIKQELHNAGLNDFVKETKKDNDEDHNELWDNWSNWSTCSVTCGNGRQVRWRHCLGGDCIKGLKKAQIKACRQKQCDSKSILHWLGIKS